MGIERSLTLRALQPGADLSPDAVHVVPVDALTALGWCKDPLTSLLLHARVGDTGMDKVAHDITMGQLIAFEFGKKRWAVYNRDKMTAGKTLRQFSLQCVREWAGEHCPSCHGRMNRYTKGGVVYTCTECGGSGRLRDPARKRMKAIGISESSYHDTWAERFDWIIGELSRMERIGWSGERKYLAEDE